MNKRINILINKINSNVHIKSNNLSFNLPPNFSKIAMNNIKPDISNCSIVQTKSCKKIPQSLKEYKTVARNRLNRNKPRLFGNHVFGPIIYQYLYQV